MIEFWKQFDPEGHFRGYRATYEGNDVGKIQWSSDGWAWYPARGGFTAIYLAQIARRLNDLDPPDLTVMPSSDRDYGYI